MDTDEFLTEYPYAKGEEFDQLELFLKKLEKQMIDMPFAVLAHYQTKNRLSKDGKLVSRWYLVDPFGKTEEKDGDVVIPIKTFSGFKRFYSELNGKIIKNPASIMENHLYPVIGSKRWKQIKECFKNDEAGEKVYKTLLEQTNFSFSRKSRRRTKQLRFAFYEILKDLVRISKKESVKPKESLKSSIPIKCFMDEEGQYCLMAVMKT